MLERALEGNKGYWTWVALLLLLTGVGFAAYLVQLREGLAVTGLSRDVSWGLYIGQFTFLVGVAASAVTVILPYYFHNVTALGRMVVFGELLAVAAVIMSILFVVVDLGQPSRLFNILLHPSPGSLMFWDMVVLVGYLLLNLVAGWNLLEAEYNRVPPPAWLKKLACISVPWAISIHTVTAFLYAGLPGRDFWMTSLMAARFLASAFASGPALLILLCLIIRRFSHVDVGREAIQKLAVIMTYAMAITVFFVGLECFTAFYSRVPGHMQSLQYLFAGLGGYRGMVPWMWTAALLALAALALLLHPGTRANDRLLALASASVFVCLWIEKGVSLIVGGFIPNAFERIVEYAPTALELLITMGVWAFGMLVLTFLCKIAVASSRPPREPGDAAV